MNCSLTPEALEQDEQAKVEACKFLKRWNVEREADAAFWQRMRQYDQEILEAILKLPEDPDGSSG